jgi:hypothetical protein
VVANASTAKERKPSPGLEGVNDFDAVLPVGPLTAQKESPAPLTWERAYIDDDETLPPAWTGIY